MTQPSFKIHFIAIFFFSTFLACSASIYDGYNGYEPRDDSYKERYEDRLPVDPYRLDERGPTAGELLPWESLLLRKDLDRVPLENFLILRGDAYVRRGERERGLEEYRRVRPEELSRAAEEALVMRIASAQLALGRTEAAQAKLGNYFVRSGRVAEDLDGRFSLLFGYLYGRLRDTDQSLAWFSRAQSISTGQRDLQYAASKGAELLLRALPDSDLYALGDVWSHDSFVRGLLGQESQRRARGGAPDLYAQKFWWNTTSRRLKTAPAREQVKSASSIGVLLPLTGKFAALGKSIQNGIALALEGEAKAKGLRLVYKDTGGDPQQAAAQARELMTTDPKVVLLGPLLAGPALAVSEAVQKRNRSVLAFSKRSYFPTGRGVFRLGPTIESQVESLLEECERVLGELGILQRLL